MANTAPGAGKGSKFLPLLLPLTMSVGLAGCASPGPPLPPSLKLPEVVAANQLTATRVGDTVALRWTTPNRTTDKLLIAGPITAVVCRSTQSPALSAPAPSTPARPARTPPCAEAVRLAVTPGPSDATDTLPAELTAGPPRPLAYRVELRNAAGHSAGPSAPVFVGAGTAPPPPQDFHAEATKPGVLLRWLQQAGADESVELTRTTVQAPKTAPTTDQSASASASKPPTGLPGQAKDPAEQRFHAGPNDAGGTLDRTVRIGRTYIYTAQRVRSVQVGKQTLELRSAPTQAVTVSVRDSFPPEVPTGLVAVPAFAESAETTPATNPATTPAASSAIDLSWEPDVEPRVAGYRVYRREGDAAWQRLTPELVPVPAYHDAAVIPGRTYTYRVAAVSDAGNESAPSTEVTETAPTL
jgi:hypothetical protein